MSINQRKLLINYMLLAVFVALNVAAWFSVRSEKVKWINVPPTPGYFGALWTGLGDEQLAFRTFGVMIQNMGDTGGRITNIGDYDFQALTKWFHLMHRLDPDSGHIPLLAGYVFGAVKDQPEKLKYIVDYMELAAGEGEGEKWRFLAQAAFLARYKMHDMDRALELAQKLANFKNPKMPVWAKQMPAVVWSATGEKEAAFQFIVNLLKTESQNLHPNEVNTLIYYLCTQTIEQEQASGLPICKPLYPEKE